MPSSPPLLDLVEAVRADAELFGPAGACPTLVEPGGNDRLLLVTGGNAGGKSLVCRYLGSKARELSEGRSGEYMLIGMGKRTEAGMHRAFIFGANEASESTGKVSSRAVRGAFRTCQGREHAHYLCLDEPDIGLSEEMQHGMGAAIADFAAALPPLTQGLVVVTHSRAIARALLAHEPWCIRAGDDLRPTRDWANSAVVPASAGDFWSLEDRARARWHAVQGVLDARKAERAGVPRPR